jgi:hypothetical protein
MPNFFLHRILEHAENEGSKPSDFLRQLLQKGLGYLIAFYTSKVDAISLKRARDQED